MARRGRKCCARAHAQGRRKPLETSTWPSVWSLREQALPAAVNECRWTRGLAVEGGRHSPRTTFT
eukprot:3850142-Alexandrium_andersonii.AAC.1